MTLTGPGGIGKTRLDLAVAAAMCDEYLAAVQYVDLARIGDAGLATAAVASALEVPGGSRLGLASHLVVTIRDAHMLILLENCERLIDACADLVDQLLISEGLPRPVRAGG